MRKLGQELKEWNSTGTSVVTRSSAVKTDRRPALAVALDETTAAELRRELANLKRLEAAARQVRKKYARACAAIAQTDTEYFQVMCKLMDPLLHLFPDHPLVQQWGRVRKIWAAQLLKKN